ncbi:MULTISPECIES: cyclopropane mycolic acid synthase family methyltransferase [Mycobacterium]|uniref:Methoxy mycolic acid synthase MmaA3 n=1 Tax=Mycobacterium kiyosense TaxID=2871094 RepID=A0A9P3UYR4_9MYCO|nr:MULTISPECIES: cyclopropane mycolic acid synthase family methyltransferase [Mycobacterium]BDB40528.1 methoxy mycolic acid synthase MmaA3 [Mycobacterium kiyosense]BDE12345.1 methoxy mycolic acid synthase MmaA3 [Mycobacterium sp. 20KCMC460]GLB86047.1 methoxy mycolic acid synthase MmaA3 [Mycobacterium kiyosense]GLB88583.1 methoxy mycolic acid synthase MmaA3 [Mycobacterium kiyosense]GLB94788.1 methoxy mycolic acid synthase MmaA3 [Mycobacterium kiyosense]
MSNNLTRARSRRENNDDVQAHYDISNEFFELFTDPTRTYSCAYFERDDMTLEEAQIAKLDLALGKLGLEPGMTLLDIGCGWGSTMKRALEKYDVNVVGVTLSKNQHAYCQQLLDQVDTNRTHQVLLSDWADFDGQVDRIITIEALEHFGFQRYDDFFKFVYNALPADGVMLLHSITGLTGGQIVERGMPVTFEMARFIKFIVTDIFPGGRLPSIEKVQEHATKAGFSVTHVESLQLHFARTLDLWAEALEANREAAIELQSEEIYERYMKYLTGSAKSFRIGYIDCHHFTLQK